MTTIIEYNARLNDDRLPIIAETKEYHVREEHLSDADTFYDLCADSIGLKDAAEEYCYCFALNTKNTIIGLFEVGHGTINQSIVDLRGIFQKALMLGASRIALAHNHPSGDPAPSDDDIAMTKRVQKAGQVLDIPLIEHLVVGNGSFYSFRAHQLI